MSKVYVKGEAEAAGKVRNVLSRSQCLSVVVDESRAGAVLEITGGQAGGSLIHIPLTGQKQYASATLFDITGNLSWVHSHSRMPMLAMRANL